MTDVNGSEPNSVQPATPAHRYRPMSGRDPHELHRVATPLELLFDLTFVVAFGVAASEFAHLLAEGHIGAGLAGFAFATFAICWAWVNFTWFASAYDTDDWVYRTLTMVQMVGVIVLTLGIPQIFASIDAGGRIDNEVGVAGYVVMRLAMVALWLRAARQDPGRRSACLTYATAISLAQVAWVATIVAPVSGAVMIPLFVFAMGVEFAGPVVAETRKGGTPWHAHHIAERYGLLTIIALGEGVVGTVASLSAVIGNQGWSVDAVLIVIAGTGLTFGMWWIYFAVPAGTLLHARRNRSFAYRYIHIALFASVVATGAGLHVAAYYIEHHSKLDSLATVLTVAIPVAVFIASVYLLVVVLVKLWDPFHLLLLALTGAVFAAAIALAVVGVSMALCLIVVTLAPLVSVVGFELVGHRHASDAVADLLADSP